MSTATHNTLVRIKHVPNGETDHLQTGIENETWRHFHSRLIHHELKERERSFHLNFISKQPCITNA